MKSRYKHNPPPNQRAKQFIQWCGENVSAWPQDYRVLALAVFAGQPFRAFQRRKHYQSLSYSWSVCTFRQWQKARKDYLATIPIRGVEITEIWMDDAPEIRKTPVLHSGKEITWSSNPFPVDYKEDFDHDDIREDINKGFSRLSEIIIRVIIWIGIPFLIGLGLYVGFMGQN